jgi:hypothetical protein
MLYREKGSRGSSGSIVSDYGLDNRAIGVRSPAGAKDLASFSRPALGPTQPPVQWVPGVLSPGLKRGRSVTLTTRPHLVPRLRMSRSYTSSPPSSFIPYSGTAFIGRETNMTLLDTLSSFAVRTRNALKPGSVMCSRQFDHLRWIYRK